MFECRCTTIDALSIASVGVSAWSSHNPISQSCLGYDGYRYTTVVPTWCICLFLFVLPATIGRANDHPQAIAAYPKNTGTIIRSVLSDAILYGTGAIKLRTSTIVSCFLDVPHRLWLVRLHGANWITCANTKSSDCTNPLTSPRARRPRSSRLNNTMSPWHTLPHRSTAFDDRPSTGSNNYSSTN